MNLTTLIILWMLRKDGILWTHETTSKGVLGEYFLSHLNNLIIYFGDFFQEIYHRIGDHLQNTKIDDIINYQIRNILLHLNSILII